jgi:hypothetical protein
MGFNSAIDELFSSNGRRGNTDLLSFMQSNTTNYSSNNALKQDINDGISTLQNKIRTLTANSAAVGAAAGGAGVLAATSGAVGSVVGRISSLAGTAIGGLGNIIVSGAESIFKDQLNVQRDLQSSEISALLKTVATNVLKPVDLVKGVISSLASNAGALIADAYDNEAKMLTSISQAGGIMGDLAGVMKEEMLTAAEEAVKFGVSIQDARDASAALSKNSGQTKLYTAETVANALKISSTLTDSAKSIFENAENFRNIGYGLQDATKIILNAGKASLAQGLTARETTKTLMANLGKLNEYGFKNGVAGLTQMVQQAQSLKLNMDKVFVVADKVFEPEGAIDMAAKLQMIGGAAGDLADPIRAMYDVTNNMEGIQSSIIDSARSLAVFDEAQGRFAVTGINLRVAKARADALGLTLGEMSSLAIKAANQFEVMSQIDMFPQFKDGDQKEFIKNMAQIGSGGTIGFEIPKEMQQFFGGQAFVELSNMTGDQVAALQRYQEQIAGASLEDLSRSQFTVQTQMMSDINSIYLLLQNNLRRGIQKTEVYDLLDSARQGLMKPNNGNAIVDGVDNLMKSIISTVPGGKGFEGEYYKEQQKKIQKEINEAKSRPISGNETTFNVNLKISGADNYANLLATTMQKDPSMKDQVVAAINEPIRSYLANA